jgi:hypothetical protein
MACRLVSCFAYSSTLMMEAIFSPETSVDFQWTTRFYVPGDSTLHNHHCENPKLYKNLFWFFFFSWVRDCVEGVIADCWSWSAETQACHPFCSIISKIATSRMSAGIKNARDFLLHNFCSKHFSQCIYIYIYLCVCVTRCAQESFQDFL